MRRRIVGKTLPAVTIVAILVAALTASGLPAQRPVGDLDGDSDRTGFIDGTPEEDRLEMISSILIKNNCDDDDKDGKPDHHDDELGCDDRADLEPVILRRLSPRPKSACLVLQSDRPAFRLFDSTGRELMAPGGRRAELTQSQLDELAKNDMTFLVEGLSFGEYGTLHLLVDGRRSDSIQLRTAPFVLTTHAHRPTESWVVRLTNLARVGGGQPLANNLILRRRMAEICRQKGITLRATTQKADRFVEDDYCTGYSRTARSTTHLALNMKKVSMEFSGARTALSPDVGHADITPRRPTEINTLNFGGNVEVTPAYGAFSHGRVVYGGIPSRRFEHPHLSSLGFRHDARQLDPALQQFFSRQRLQTPAVRVCTDWLRIGHVDEVIAFIPVSHPKHTFVVLVADPRLAMRMLLDSPQFPLDKRYLSYGMTNSDELLRGDSGLPLLDLSEYNRLCADRIFGKEGASKHPRGTIVPTLASELDLSPDQIISVPVLFHNKSPDDDVFGAVAMTPTLANVCSLGGVCVAPKPHIPIFARRFEQSLSAVGQRVFWIDDWYELHLLSGEVHCATNEFRTPDKGVE